MVRILLAFPALMLLATTVLEAGVAGPADVNIEGTVKDAQTGEQLPGANVILAGTSFGASSDIHGKYTIRNVPPGSYTIRATYVGYTPFSATLLIEGTTNISRDFKLDAVAIEGQAVIVTAQALGQNQAINQQLSSDRIVNVVSSARIQELPDANAAESVGRLPGVSVTRQGGEGNQVIIRGLSPKYNEVMIDGVPMAPTDAGDRGTDLSMISSSMLEGIEVTKAITPDMDAEVLGGTVNFKLKEARETESGIPRIGLLAQGAYNGLEKTYNNYKVVGSIETRFLENKLGVLAELNAERKNLTSNELGGSYSLNEKNPGVQNPVYLSNLNLNDILRDRKRYGGTFVMDYRIPDGKVSLVNLFSSGDTRTQDRGESYNVSVTGRSHQYSTTVSQNTLNVITNLLEYQQALPLFVVDAKLSHSYSENRDPNDVSINFVNSNDGVSGPAYQRLDPRLIPELAVNDLSQTKLQGFSGSSSFSRDRSIVGSLDILSPVRVSDDITGSVKIGGKIQYRARSYDFDQSDGAVLVSGGGLRQAILDAFPWMKQQVPTGVAPLPITLFEDGVFSYGKFLGGDYTMGAPINIALLQPVINIARQFGQLEAWSHNALASLTNDYSGFEHQGAVYAMLTANLGEKITLLGGARYQNLRTSYTAPRGQETNTSHFNFNPRDTTINESQGGWLPMAHLIYRPCDWLQVRFAYTNTLAYPDYNTITPRIDLGFSSVSWNNFALRESHSSNYDLVVSLLDNGIGLFSVDGFYKRIDNLIFPISRFVIDPSQYPGPPESPAGYVINTSFNDPFVVDLLGVEIDWQTHFWYLPDPLSGLVLSVNFTHIFSRAQYPLTTVGTTYSPDPPYVIKTYNETFYEARLINQPDNIVNLALGYDYSGFSTRVSLLYQADVFKGEDFWPELRINTARYLRWDLSVKQALPWSGLQAFFDLNNFNNARDVDLNQGSGFPTAEQYYGLTADVGLRLRF
jgi:TonB-dependent receptor